MATPIKHYNGNTLVSVSDGNLVTTAASIYFPGKGLNNYGETVLENILWTVENFSNTHPPYTPTQGQLWFDTNTRQLRLYDTSYIDAPVPYWGTITLSSPINKNPVNPIINNWNSIDSIQITDTNGVNHQAWRIAVATQTHIGNVAAVFSGDQPYTTNVSLTGSSVNGINTIYPGITLPYLSNVRVSSPTLQTNLLELNSQSNQMTNGGIGFDGKDFNFTMPGYNNTSFTGTPVYQEYIRSLQRVYVSPAGYDVMPDGTANTGDSMDRPMRSLRAALATSKVQNGGCTIYLESGTYIETNPLLVPSKTSIVGDNLRRTLVIPQNPQLDVFHVLAGTYFYGMTIRGHRNPAFAFAFPASTAVTSIDGLGNVTAITSTHSYAGYILPPAVHVEYAPSSIGSNVTVSTNLVNGAVTEAVVTNAGFRYDNGATVNIHGSNTTPATATARIAYIPALGGNVVVAIDMIEVGSGYNYNDISITISGSNTTPATAVIPVGGVTVTNCIYGQYSNAVLIPVDGIQNGIISSYSITNTINGPYPVDFHPHVSVPVPFAGNLIITSSPYVQNCSSITGPWDINGLQIPLPGSLAIPPQNDGGATGPLLPWYSNTQPTSSTTPFAAQDLTGAGGGIRVDGMVITTGSPINSFVVDSFTQINQGGIGHLLLNRGYAQFVSCFTTFSSVGYWARSGGFANISNSVVDFGNIGLRSDGFYPIAYTSGVVNTSISSTVSAITQKTAGSGYNNGISDTFIFPLAFTINGHGGAIVDATGNIFVQNGQVITIVLDTPGVGYTSAPTLDFSNGQSGNGFVAATATLTMVSSGPLLVSNLLTKPRFGSVVTFGYDDYFTISDAVDMGSNVWQVTTTTPILGVSATNPVRFFDVSNLSTGSLAFEYVGAGVNYNALPSNGGVPNVNNEIVETSPGRVYYVTVDNTGNFRVGKFFHVNFIDGNVSISSNNTNIGGLTSIGPLFHNNVPVGTYADEISNDINLTHSLPPNPYPPAPADIRDQTTIPTQYAVKEYVDMSFSNITSDIVPNQDLMFRLGHGSPDSPAPSPRRWKTTYTGNLSVSYQATGTTLPAATNTTDFATTAFVHNVLPHGAIIMWSGSISSIPVGWNLCDGSNGTPDLRDRFVIAAGNNYAVGTIGGNVTVSLTGTATGTSNAAGAHDLGGSAGNTTLDLTMIPAHTHSINDPGHSHPITDPGHQHQDPYAEGGVESEGFAPVDGTSGSIGSGKSDFDQSRYWTSSEYTGINATNGTTTGITVTNAAGGGSGHTHTISTSSTHTHTATLSVSASGTSLPPYLSLAYIMKIVG